MALCEVSVALPLFGIQEQNVEISKQTPGGPSQQLDNLQRQLGWLDRELNSIREEVTRSSSLKTEKKRKLLKQVNHLGDELACLKTELASIRQGATGVSIPPPFSASGKSRNCGFPAPPSPKVGPGTPPSIIRLVQYQESKGLMISLTHDYGPFAIGQNNFCVEFRNDRTGDRVDAGDVQVDFTLTIGRLRIKAIRAVTHLAQAGTGRYCGRVGLVAPGDWSVRVRYEGPSGEGKMVFRAIVRRPEFNP